MKLVLRNCLTGDIPSLRGAKVLCRRSKKIAFLVPYAGQWVFYSLIAPNSPQLRYNRSIAPARCRLAVGDLLDLNGLELVVESIEVDTGTHHVETGELSSCEIEAPGKSSIRVTYDLLIGYDPCAGLCLPATLDLQPLTALLTFAAGLWHLHDLNGTSLVRNGSSAGPSLVLADGDRVRIHDNELRFHIRTAARAGGGTETRKQADTTGEIIMPLARCKETAEIVAASTQKIDPVYREAKALWRELWPALREPGRKFRPQGVSRGGIKGWLRILRRPRSPAETLERLRFLLSGSPRDRVWLSELAHFFFQQSYLDLCVRVLKELCRLYPDDVAASQTLAKFYYQQGCNPQLPASERLDAFVYANRRTQFVRQLSPNDLALTDLEQAISREQTFLRDSLSEKASSSERAESTGRKG